MDFLKSILGDDLYSQVESKINAYNSDEANKDKQIKIANLTSGEYISKNKFTDLETEKALKVLKNQYFQGFGGTQSST